MRIITTAIATILAGAALATPAHAVQNAYPANVSESATVAKILTDNNLACTGVLVDDDWVLTAAHCVTSNEVGGSVSFGNGAPAHQFRYSGTVKHDTQDIALLHLDYPVPANHIAPSPVAALAPKKNDRVKFLGFGGRSDGYLGKLDMYVKEQSSTNVIVKSSRPEPGVNLVPGDSGAPVFNANGEVVGIASRAIRPHGEQEFTEADVNAPVYAKVWIDTVLGVPQEETLMEQMHNGLKNSFRR